MKIKVKKSWIIAFLFLFYIIIASCPLLISTAHADETDNKTKLFEGYSMPLHEEEDKYQKLFEETNTYHYNGI